MRRRIIKLLAIILTIIITAAPLNALAVEGTMGYSGGISVVDPIEKVNINIQKCAF